MPFNWNYLKALAAAIIWGASFVATKTVLREVSPVAVIILRFGIGVLVLAFALWQLNVREKIDARDWLLLLILGAMCIPIHQGLQVNGLVMTTATSVSWLVTLTPVFTAILALVFLSEPFGVAKTLGLVIAFAGASVVITRGVFSSDVLRLPSTAGDFLALASSLNWAIFSVASKPFLRRMHPTLMIALVMGLGWVLTLPIAASAQSWNEIFKLSATGWIAIAFLGIFCSGLAYLFWYDALARLEASQTVAFLYVEPLVTVAVAAVVLGEIITPLTFLGGLTILLGVYLVNRASARRAAAGIAVASD
jgi:drug/metabolite transporter (DMT)-like permease